MLISCFVYGQENYDGIILKSGNLSDEEVVRDILLMEGIEGFELNFSGTELINKHYLLIVKELWNGSITMTDTIIDSSKYNDILKIKEDTFSIKVMAKKLADDRLKVIFTFPKVRNTKYYKSTNSDDYSLRNLSNREDFTVELGNPFYLLSYVLPYEKDGIKDWCTVDKSGADVENWGNEFGLEHYLVYEMVFK
jgi:hypothetical protein